MKRIALLAAALLLFTGASCSAPAGSDGSTLVYGCGEIERINPAMDEHGEINALLFDGLTAHDAENRVIPSLAREWEFDEAACSYTFHLEQDVKWHDGEAFDAHDVKFTVEAIMDPGNGSENAANYEDVLRIDVEDEHTVTFVLEAPNAAFLHYMSIPMLPEHLLAGEDMQTSDFFRAPVGTGPYRLESWEQGQSLTLSRNEGYFAGRPGIDTIIFSMIPDDSARAMQLMSGGVDLAQLPPRGAEPFDEAEGFEVYRMKTSDYRGIMFNFTHEYWVRNRDIIPALCCMIDRGAIVDAVLLGQGEEAYSPLQRNEYNEPGVERYEYDVERAAGMLGELGCTMGEDGFYRRDGEKLGFTLNSPAGDQARLDIALAAAQQMRDAGVDVTVETPLSIDWGAQMAYLIGWGSPYDADDHTYKVFGSGKGANYSGYSNAAVDESLTLARRSQQSGERAAAYSKFQHELAKDPAFAMICYIDAVYVAREGLTGIDPGRVLGHHGVGIFDNVEEWSF